MRENIEKLKTNHKDEITNYIKNYNVTNEESVKSS